MKCKNCGKEILKGDKYCTHCGSKILNKKAYIYFFSVMLIIFLVYLGSIIFDKIVLSKNAKKYTDEYVVPLVEKSYYGGKKEVKFLTRESCYYNNYSLLFGDNKVKDDGCYIYYYDIKISDSYYNFYCDSKVYVIDNNNDISVHDTLYYSYDGCAIEKYVKGIPEYKNSKVQINYINPKEKHNKSEFNHLDEELKIILKVDKSFKENFSKEFIENYFEFYFDMEKSIQVHFGDYRRFVVEYNDGYSVEIEPLSNYYTVFKDDISVFSINYDMLDDSYVKINDFERILNYNK